MTIKCRGIIMEQGIFAENTSLTSPVQNVAKPVSQKEVWTSPQITRLEVVDTAGSIGFNTDGFGTGS